MLKPSKEFYFKLIVVLFSVLLFLFGAFLLFLYDVVDFNWSRELKKDFAYNESKHKNKRILVLGDSQLEKDIADQSLFIQIQNFCRENDIGFASAAHFGYGPIEYKRALEKYANDYQPDLIIMFYNFHNDLTDAMFRFKDEPTELNNPLYIDQPEKSSSSEHIQPDSNDQIIMDEIKNLPADNHTFDWDGFLAYGIDPEMVQYAKNRLANQYAQGDFYVNPHILVLAKWLPDYLMYNLLLFDIRSKYTWYRVLNLFEEMLQISEAIHSKLVVVGLPSTVQVDQSHFDFYRKLKMTVSEDFISTSIPQQLMDSFCTASNLVFLDLLPVLKSTPDHEKLYYQNDDHLNTFGHKITFQELEKKVLLPFLENKLSIHSKPREIDYYKNYNEWKRSYYIYVSQKRLGLSD